VVDRPEEPISPGLIEGRVMDRPARGLRTHQPTQVPVREEGPMTTSSSQALARDSSSDPARPLRTAADAANLQTMPDELWHVREASMQRAE
jgi:hypothetical protein